LVTLLGDIYLERGDLATAQKYFEQALAAKPDFAVAASNLAWVHAQQGSNLDLALNLARSANRQLPELDSVVDTLGWVHYRKGQYSEAVSLLRECVQKAPSQAIYRYHLGMALISDGQKDEGRREVQAALRLKLSREDASQARDALAQLQ
jgi:Flp pilus assembly protein TadD